MGLYIVRGRGAGARREVWVPGDSGRPNYADTKQEFLDWCSQPERLPCPSAECSELGTLYAHTSRGIWGWAKMSRCRRCQELRNRHGLELTDLIAMWESQGRRCFRCLEALPDPRIMSPVRGRGRDAKIDHDHKVCPQKSHSCDRCRRGLACTACNTHALAIRTIGIFNLPQGNALAHWLESLGPGERDRLRRALALFPEQPARRPSRRQQRGDATVVPLFDSDACA